MALFKCTNCGLSKNIPNKYLGDLVNCPKCEGLVEIGLEDGADLDMESIFRTFRPMVGPDQTLDAPLRAQVDLDAPEDDLSSKPTPFFHGGVAGNLVAGAGSGLLLFFFSLAYAGLFQLAGFGETMLPPVLGMTLVGASLICVFTAAGSRVPFGIAAPESGVAVLLFLLLGSLASSLEGGPVFPTLVAGVAVSAVFTGFFIYTCGKLELGRWMRFIPHQLLGGLAAGVGFLLVRNAWDASLAGAPCIQAPDWLLQWSPCPAWLLPLAFGLVLLVCMRAVRSSLTALIPILAAIGLTHAYFAFVGAPPTVGGAGSWFFPSFSPERMFEAYFSKEFFTAIRWRPIIDHAPYMIALAALAAISSMLRVMAFESVMHRPLNLDRELRTLGAANVVAGLCGGVPGAFCLGRSLGHRAAGGRGPGSGVFAGAVCGAGLIASGYIAPLIPVFVPVGLLFYSGLSLMQRWLLQTRGQFSRTGDYLLLALVFLITISFGVLAGMGMGMGLALLHVISRYSREGVVRHTLSGARYPSSVDRSPREREILAQKGNRISIIRLQGYLFHGSLHDIAATMRRAVHSAEHPDLRCIILDFTRVAGVDSLAGSNLLQLVSLAREHEIICIFTNVPFEVTNKLEQSGRSLNAPDGYARSFVDLDYALEWCENELLEEEAARSDAPEKDLATLLRPLFPSPDLAPRFITSLHKLMVHKGQTIFQQGAQAKTMFFVESGMVNVQLELEPGMTLRLRKAGPGAVVGEMGLFTNAPRAASAVAAEDCVVYQLSARTVHKLRTHDPELASAIDSIVVQLLADRVVKSNSKLRELML